MELNAAGLWSDFKNRSLCAGGGWQQHGGHEYGGERKPDLSHSAPDARPFVSQCQQNFRSHRNFVRGPETCAFGARIALTENSTDGRLDIAKPDQGCGFCACRSL